MAASPASGNAPFTEPLDRSEESENWLLIGAFADTNWLMGEFADTNWLLIGAVSDTNWLMGAFAEKTAADACCERVAARGAGRRGSDL